MGKLVRDKIPEIILEDGMGIKIRYLGKEEYTVELERKLDEEVAEFKSSKSPEELADILTVIYAIAENMGISYDELNKIMDDKRLTRGGFSKKIYLEDTFEV